VTGPFDRIGPERPQQPVGLRPPSWAWLLGLVALVAVVGLTVTLIKTGGGKGTPGLEPGTLIPPFAAPLVLSPIDGDVNLARKANAGDAGVVPACSITRAGVLTSCALTAKTPLILVFSTLNDRCLRQLDVLNAFASTAPQGPRVVGVAARGDRGRWRQLVRQRWRFPVVYDRDGAMTGVYGVQLCPQILIVHTGGRVAATVVGEISAQALRRKLRVALRSDGNAS